MHNLAAGLFSQALAELSILVRFLGGEQAQCLRITGCPVISMSPVKPAATTAWDGYLGLGMTYTRAKADHMATDTIEGAELAFTMSRTLDAMMKAGALPKEKLPLTRAIVPAICQDQPFDPCWRGFLPDMRN